MKKNYYLDKVIKEAETEMLKLNHPYVGSEHMLLGILKIDCNVTKTLNSYNLTYENFKNNLQYFILLSFIAIHNGLYLPFPKKEGSAPSSINLQTDEYLSFIVA